MAGFRLKFIFEHARHLLYAFSCTAKKLGPLTDGTTRRGTWSSEFRNISKLDGVYDDLPPKNSQHFVQQRCKLKFEFVTFDVSVFSQGMEIGLYDVWNG